MSNGFWYGCITILGIMVFIYTLVKVRDEKVVVLYTFIAGLTYLFEYVIFVLLNSYAFHPDLLKNEYYDSVLGAVFSDAISVPMTAVFIGAFSLPWKQIALIIGIFCIIEEVFLYVGAYEHYWWKTSYTAFGLLFCFTISKWWYKKIQVHLSTGVRFIDLYFTCLFLQSSIAFVLTAFLGMYQYHIGWFENDIRDHVAFATAYIIFLAFIFTSLVTFRVRWIGKFIVISCLFPLNWLFLRYDILQLLGPWSVGHFLIVYFTIVVLLTKFDEVFLSDGVK